MAPITITKTATEELKSILDHKKIPDGYLVRIGAKGNGCSGVSYVLGFDLPKQDDERHIINGLEILIAQKDFMHLVGVEVDYEEHEDEQGFVFNV